ncbi:Uu.00g046900.m01.CDS01 [Anthostomella pinea]|uniref:Uu.00g046900.m01.CDS01 n=1 Tax=Anthostomella pinea TaxID=933095 RepID=A0AAI8VC50_9PEZI|nr:Uu.00g046900.m01.CDS01 [Anthostomella pinea]
MSVKALFVITTALASLASAIPVQRHRQTRQTAALPIVVIEGSTPDADGLALTQATESLYLYHSRLGQAGTSAIVVTEVAAADAFWHATLSNATGRYVAGKARIQVLVDPAVLNASSVGAWFAGAGTGWPNDFLESSPTHFLGFIGAGTSDPAALDENTEGWGKGPITYFKGKLEERPAFIPALEDFSEDGQFNLGLALKDGTTFAHSLTGFRDLPDGEGVEVFQGIWIPDNVPDYVVSGLQEHLTVETANWLRLAYRWVMTKA